MAHSWVVIKEATCRKQKDSVRSGAAGLGKFVNLMCLEVRFNNPKVILSVILTKVCSLITCLLQDEHLSVDVQVNDCTRLIFSLVTM